MLLTPVAIVMHGWRGLWSDIGLFNLFWALLIGWCLSGDKKTSGKQSPAIDELLEPVKKLGPLCW